MFRYEMLSIVDKKTLSRKIERENECLHWCCLAVLCAMMGYAFMLKTRTKNVCLVKCNKRVNLSRMPCSVTSKSLRTVGVAGNAISSHSGYYQQRNVKVVTLGMR